MYVTNTCVTNTFVLYCLYNDKQTPGSSEPTRTSSETGMDEAGYYRCGPRNPARRGTQQGHNASHCRNAGYRASLIVRLCAQYRRSARADPRRSLGRGHKVEHSSGNVARPIETGADALHACPLRISRDRSDDLDNASARPELPRIG